MKARDDINRPPPSHIYISLLIPVRGIFAPLIEQGQLLFGNIACLKRYLKYSFVVGKSDELNLSSLKCFLSYIEAISV